MSTPSPAGNGTIQVSFLHPRDSREFKAEIGKATTGQVALDGLIKAGFVEAASKTSAYTLMHQRTSKSLPLSGSLVSSGVEAADIIEVVTSSAGAGV